MTFFAAVAFALIPTIIGLYMVTASDAPLRAHLVPVILSVALIVNILCVLFWGKARLEKDPKAFSDE